MNCREISQSFSVFKCWVVVCTNQRNRESLIYICKVGCCFVKKLTMALSDSDVKKQAEEEFNIEKGHLVQDQRVKIMQYYEKKEKQIKLQKKIQSSNMLNQARLKVLKAREDHIRNVLDEARKHLGDLTRDQSQYQKILHRLIVQALLQMLEKEVIIFCRQQDFIVVQNSVTPALEEYCKTTSMDCKVVVDPENFLPSDMCGGVELIAQRGKIKISNTLEKRLEMISQKLLPDIRTALFGNNSNRRFMD
ncbi:V-type proton ATPase subunit E-like isoform X1 [Tachypleus tridentatus]|uniref:V-type proton ATPase subunit E-like isoform X1 n=1 Tax=Tachypleus tridentatus TaxID=6853 RepID=UPI003FD19AD0